jgi:hypothetical protein
MKVLMDIIFEEKTSQTTRKNSVGYIASINPSVEISVLQKNFALIGNFQERIVQQSNISLLKLQEPNLESKQIDLAMKSYNVHEIPHIYQLYVGQNQASFIF